MHAWTYRDWVVQAFHSDLPYNRFLLLQLAADQVPDRTPTDLAAMGFLTLGRRFLGVKHDILDDRIDVITRGLMGLTVTCARCHDHKFDPVSQADYYALYGVLRSSVEPSASNARVGASAASPSTSTVSWRAETPAVNSSVKLRANPSSAPSRSVV